MIRELMPDERYDFPNIPDHVETAHTRGIEIDGELVAVFGVAVVSPGVGNVWVILADGDHRRHALALVRSAHELVELVMDRLNLHRIQTTIPADNYELGKWIGLCGFTAESVMTMGGPNGEDLVVFRKLRGH